jgi:DNA-binding beta-propeller fold protein YncE
MRKIGLVASIAAVLTTLLSAPQSMARDDPHRILLALSKADHMLALVDAQSLKVMAKIDVGIDPHEVVASPDGTRAYVSIYGGGRLHEIDVIDLVARKPLATLDTMPLYGPHGLAFANGKLWFTAEGSKAIGEYDPVSNKFDWSMGTSQVRTHMIYVSPDASRIYATNVSSGTVSILENKSTTAPTFGVRASSTSPSGVPITGWTETVVPVTQGSEGFDGALDRSRKRRFDRHHRLGK